MSDGGSRARPEREERAETGSSSPRDRSADDSGNGGEELTQEQRALKHISAIAGGANVTEQASELSNEFTDRFLARMGEWFSRRRRT